MKRIVLWMMIAVLFTASGCNRRTARELTEIETDAGIAYLAWCRDMTNETKAREYETLAAEADRMRFADDPAMCRLLSRERALVMQYFLLPITLTVERDGSAWTGDAILNDPTLSEESFAALYEAYSERFSAEAGAIYLELLEVRREIAHRNGFADYTAYAYAQRGRAYAPADAATLSERIRSAFVPQLSGMQTGFYSAAARLYGLFFSPEQGMTCARDAVASLLPELGTRWDELLAEGHFDVGTGQARMPVSFAASLPRYGLPVLFIDWTGAFDMPAVLIHTFGRCASADSGYGARFLSDLSEIDAQGLELLTVLRYDTIYGDFSDAAEAAALFYAIYALLDGCAENAFEQAAFAADRPTVGDLNAAYGRIAERFGLDAFGAEARAWTRDPYLFLTPCSGIGRAVGMLAALELFLDGTEDPAAAADAYRAILRRGGDATLSETLRAAMLADPFSEDAVERIALRIGAYRNERMRKDYSS
jgi:hypothetical protein